MAEAVSVIAAIAAIISLTEGIFGAARTQRNAQMNALVDNYGPAVGLPVHFFLGNTAIQYLRIQRSVLNGEDQDAVDFRQAVTYECNMTAVAVRLSPDFRHPSLIFCLGCYHSSSRNHGALFAEPKLDPLDRACFLIACRGFWMSVRILRLCSTKDRWQAIPA